MLANLLYPPHSLTQSIHQLPLLLILPPRKKLPSHPHLLNPLSQSRRSLLLPFLLLRRHHSRIRVTNHRVHKNMTKLSFSMLLVMILYPVTRQLSPVDNPFSSTTVPEFVTGGFEAEITSEVFFF